MNAAFKLIHRSLNMFTILMAVSFHHSRGLMTTYLLDCRQIDPRLD